MNSIDTILSAYAWNLDYAKELASNIPERIFAKKPTNPGLPNHPAWTMGHLALASAKTRKHFTGKLDIPIEWKICDRKGPGDETPLPAEIHFPKKDELMAELERQHVELAAVLKKVKAKDLDAPTRWFYSKRLPTVGQMVHYMCVTHEALHLGQVAAWRRAYGLEDSAMARLK